MTERSGHAGELIGKLIDEGARVFFQIFFFSWVKFSFFHQLLLDHCDCVVAFGGDGTISECASGYLLANGKDKGVAFAVFPFGQFFFFI